MAKTKPIGIRFDEDDLSIVLLKCKKKTKQFAVDYLFKMFADTFRLKVENVFDVLVKEENNIVLQKNNYISNTATNVEKIEPPIRILKTYDYYQKARLDCICDDDWDILKKEIMSDIGLTIRQKSYLTN